MQKYADNVQFANGDAVVGAFVTVTQYPSGAAATIYRDDGITPYPTNVIRTDETGEYSFYAANGRYTISISALSLGSDEREDVILFDPDEFDGGGGGGGGGGDFSSDTSSSVDGEVVVFSGTSGKLGRRFTGTGVLKATSGVASAGQVSLTAEVTGALPIANGGTNATSASAARTNLGAGDVVGPASAVNNRVAFFDGTTGKLIKDSGLTLSGSNTGDQTITLTGDVTGSGTGSFAATIANDAVTNAKAANMATKTYKGRTSSGTGDPEDVAVATVRVDLGEKVQALTDGATISVDASLANNFRVTLGGNRTLANPTNLIDGQVINFRIKQDGTGSRTLAYGSNYKFPGGSAPVLSTGAGALDFMSCQYDATDGTLVCVMNKAFA